jgi:molybdopterin synthase catalytic subunit
VANTFVDLVTERIDVAALRAKFENPGRGAVVVYEGVVRSRTADRSTEKLHYEAYPEMAIEAMRRIAEEQANADTCIVHRIGELFPGETAVVCIVACAHRAEAFDTCRKLIDRVKEEVPIWKKEFGPQGEEWA